MLQIYIACYQDFHKCAENCGYCEKEGVTAICGDKCGHSGQHNCRIKSHRCGKACSLSKFRGCQEKCMSFVFFSFF